MVTKEQIKKVVMDDCERETRQINLFIEFKKATAHLVGKPISKRIATAFHKAIGESYTVYYSNEYGMYHVTVWGGPAKLGYEDRVRIMLGYDSTPSFQFGQYNEQHSGIEYWNNSMGNAAIERNRLRVKLLEDDAKLQQIADDLNAFVIARDKLAEYNVLDTPSWYSIEKLIKE